MFIKNMFQCPVPCCRVTMARMLTLWLAALCVSVSARFHLPSRVEYEGPKGSNFGFSLAFQKSQKLFVGMPRLDMDGGVKSCPIWPDAVNQGCVTSINSTNMEGVWGDFSRKTSPEQQFMLGATVAATKDYLLACAPLLTIENVSFNNKTKYSSTKYVPAGRCFIQRDTDNLQAVNNTFRDACSLGWSALVDEEVDALIVSKLTGAHGTYMHTRISNPDKLRPAQLNAKRSDKDITDARYVGPAMATGLFFSDKKKVYATAWEETGREGRIGFLNFIEERNKRRLKIIIPFANTKMFFNREKKRDGQNMFGAALHMADFTRDKYSELVVGAPAEPYKDQYEAGAVFIYRGGRATSQIADIGHRPSCILHNIRGARFGTALASLDLDSDGLPELFISAPFEAKGGVVYVVSGADVQGLLDRSECQVLNQYYQKLTSEMDSFGFFLRPAVNFDDNGGNVLAIGAPLADKVVVYRSIPAVKVKITPKLKDQDIVRELDNNFTVTVTIDITYSRKHLKPSGQLFVDTDIIVIDQNKKLKSSAIPKIEVKHFIIDLSLRQTQVVKDIVVLLSDDRPHTYKFSAIVSSDTKLLEKKDFDNNLIMIIYDKESQSDLLILRKCKGNECVPRLTMDLHWSQGSDDYELGSSQYETLTVKIKNDGNSSYESCVRVNITGAKIADWNCDDREVSDTCRFEELTGGDMHSLNMRIGMGKISYGTDMLNADVYLYNKCSDKMPTAHTYKNIKYIPNTENIAVTGSYLPLNVTDRDIADHNTSIVGLLETFTIANNLSVSWEGLIAELAILKRPYVHDFMILNQDNIKCTKQNATMYIKYICTINLNAKALIELKTKVDIDKSAVVDNLNEKKLLIFDSYINLSFSHTKNKKFSLIASAMYIKDTSFVNQKTYIMIAAILISLLVLLIIALILYKCGFFERSKKKELIVLKTEWKRRSTMAPPDSTHRRINYDGELYIEEVDEDEEDEASWSKEDHPKSS